MLIFTYVQNVLALNRFITGYYKHFWKNHYLYSMHKNKRKTFFNLINLIKTIIYENLPKYIINVLLSHVQYYSSDDYHLQLKHTVQHAILYTKRFNLLKAITYNIIYYNREMDRDVFFILLCKWKLGYYYLYTLIICFQSIVITFQISN